MRHSILLFALLTVGCGKGTFKEQAAKPGAGQAEKLRITYQNPPATFDPAFSQTVENNDLMALVYDGLVGWSEDNRIEARLAESWDVSKDGRTYTFHLRKDLKFSDGRPLTAEDVRWTWERNLDPDTGSPLAQNYLGDIQVMPDHHAITAIDDQTLKVTIKEPKPSFLGKLTYPAAFVMPKGKPDRITNIKDMIGAGPFSLQLQEPNVRLVLEPNRNYYRGGAEAGVRIRIVGDSSTRLTMFKGGELDILTVGQQEVAGILADKTLSAALSRNDRAAVVYIGMNGENYKPFADPRVRRAFMMAVDRDYITTKILNGFGRKADGILPPTIPQTPRTKPIPAYDVEGAKKLIKESGWEGRLPSIDLWVNDANKDRKTISEFVCSQLKEHLGVDAKVRLADANFIIQKATNRELGFFYGSWYADYLDPENFLSVLLSSYGQNRTNYDNPRFSDLCRQADVEPDSDKRLKLYAEAEDLALQDCPWIPLYFPQDAVVVQPWVKDLKRNAFGYLPPAGVSLKR